IKETYESLDNARLLVGFNRRFSPSVEKVKSIFRAGSSEMIINYRVNAGPIGKEHWSQDREIGGGRIIGEMCHFIDLMQYLTNAIPEEVYAACLNQNNQMMVNEDNLTVTVKFSNG